MAERGTGTGHEDGPEPFDEEAAWAAIVAGYGDEPEFPGDDPPAREPAPGPGALPGFLETEKPVKPFPAGAESEPGKPARGGAGREPVRRESGPAGTEPSDTAGEAGTSGAEGAGSGSADPSGAAGRPGAPVSPGSGPAAGADRPLGSSVIFPAGTGPRDWSPREPAGDAGGAGGGEGGDEDHFVPPEPPPLPEADTPTKFAWLAVLGGPLLLIVTVLAQQPVTWWIATLGVGGFLGGFATLVARMREDDEEDDDPGRGAVV
ncbi:hypothetical protein [Streptomyces xinghaiensis]|uniref:hypothetical protein n=1 Tax=Streptomyces xinghaiensis TaxID=1038928 RepID=UPI000BB02910|nr:hypothetical protein [Streptomyces xinghaiensis]